MAGARYGNGEFNILSKIPLGYFLSGFVTRLCTAL